MRNAVYAGSALALLLSAVGPAAAQVVVQPAPGTPVVQPAPAAGQPAATGQPAANINAWRAKNVLGSKVFVQNNTGVGTVDDIVFDDGGNVEYLVVNSEGKLVSVPWEAAKFNPQQQSAVINVTPQVWQTIPTYTTTTYPAFFTPQYQTTTYRYFGLTPGEARRLDRRLDRRDRRD